MNLKSESIFYFIFLMILSIISSGYSQIQDNDVLPPDILPVVILSGSDYEMGYQYGQQAGHLIEKNKDVAWAEALVKYEKDVILKSLKANHYYIKKYTPENIEIMKGIADGATDAGYKISYMDVVLMNCTLPKPETSTYPPDANEEDFPPKKCSVASAWGTATKSGKLIGMDTLDGGEANFGVLIIAFPDNGNNYACGAYAGSIGSHFLMNNKGLFIGNSGGGGSHRDIDQNYGISWFCGLPHMARFANNAIEAKDIITSWQIDIAENFHLADVDGNAFVVEKTAVIQSIRKSGDFNENDFMFSTNNYLNDKMSVTKKGDFIKKHGGYGAYSSPRNLMLWDMLHNYHGQVDVEFMKMILRFPGSPPPFPPTGGWDAKICRPSNSWVSVLQPDKGDNGIINFCTGPAGRVIHSSQAWDDTKMKSNYLYIFGTHTFFQLTLGKDPLDIVSKSKASAKNDIAAAYKEIMGMNFNDVGYAALDELYNLAVQEYFLGSNALNKAIAADEKEAIGYFAEAATKFTRSQAHALQVYEVLHPAATSPSGLGLKTFGDNWAEWETEVGTNQSD
jgi:hypothetical protein